MIDREPSIKDMALLWNTCIKFIEAQRISCPETIYQTDWVIENAYEFIQDICDQVGYQESEDDE